MSGSRFNWEEVRAHYEAGHTVAQCQDRFGFSKGAWARAVERGDVAPRPKWSGTRASEKRAVIGRLLAEGMTQAAIGRKLGMSKATVSYHARRLGVAVNDKCARRYDWREIQRAHDSGLSARQCAAQFGFWLGTWTQAVRRGAIVPRPHAMPITELLVVGRRTNRSHLKQRLLREGLKENRCEECGITEWRGKPLNMQLHHVNGDGRDNRLENLRLLCANCHSQTDTYGGRNGHRRLTQAGESTGGAGQPLAGGVPTAR